MANRVDKGNVRQLLDDSGRVFYRVNRKTRKGTYSISPEHSQHKYCEKIQTEGFDRLPRGFYTNAGYGLTGAGSTLLREIHEKYGKTISLMIVATGSPKLDARGRSVSVTLPQRALAKINDEVRATKRLRNEEVRADVRNFLARSFTQFKDYKNARAEYTGGTLASLLSDSALTKRISSEDRQALEDFIPEYLGSIQGTLRAKAKLKVVFDSLDAGKKLYFEKILKEFNSKLNKKVQNEAVWQRFLSDYLLVLRNSYGEVLEKESVSLSGKYPDFMLIDPYGYLDIYEIKKPGTTLLRHDRSRDNYYWDTEISKAISQVENYLHQVQRNSDSLINDIRRNKGISINVVRPRGYIIAGTRSQLATPKMTDDFRILSESLKSIDVILYDDLLANLETFVNRAAAH